MAAREQLIAMETIWAMMNGVTGHLGKTDFIPQKITFPNLDEKPYFARVSPESEGIDSGMLACMIRELAGSRLTDLHHLMILRRGNVICECSIAPYRSNIWHVTHSMCKSITGMAIGMLLSEGKLSLSESIYEIFGKKTGRLRRLAKPDVTVEHLLTMTSLVQFNEMGAIAGNDWVQGFLDAPVRGIPGSEFEYNSMNSYMLSAIITEKTGMSMMEYLRPRLFEPLRIRQIFWESCPLGITKGGWGLFLRPEDAAKLGQMCLQNGKFEGKQILPAEWLAYSTVCHADTPEKMGAYGYGFQVWMGERPGSYAFNGMLGQNVLVCPDIEMVIVTNAGSNELFQNCFLVNAIHRYFGSSYHPKERLAENPTALAELESLCRRLAGTGGNLPVILRGGWKKRGVYRRMCLMRPGLPADLSGRIYEIEGAGVGIFPLVMQVFHNNFTDGISRIGFWQQQGRFYLLLQEGEDFIKLEVGLHGAACSYVTVHRETYLAAAEGSFSYDEDGTLILKLNIAFLEESVRRLLRIAIREDSLSLAWDETPGQDLIKEGLETLLTTLAGTFIQMTLKSKIPSTILHYMMQQTITPTQTARLLSGNFAEEKEFRL